MKKSPAAADVDAWLRTSQARCLVEIPVAPDRFSQAMENRLRLAFEAGFTAGVKARSARGST